MDWRAYLRLFGLFALTVILLRLLPGKSRSQRRREAAQAAWKKMKGESFTIMAANADYPDVDDASLPPWKRHAIWMGADSDVRDDYPAAFYHTEYDDDYERDLCTALGCKKDSDVVTTESWGPLMDMGPVDEGILEEADVAEGRVPVAADPPGAVQRAFKAVASRVRGAVADVARKANRGPAQILHERWTSYRATTGSTSRFQVIVEFVVYRPPAHHAKHIAVTGVVDTTGVARVQRIVDAKVVGNLFQDQFAFLPVVAANLGPAMDASPY
jgi:hypothetical protein